MQHEANREQSIYDNLHLPRIEGLWGVYLSEFFRRMTIGLIGLFVPIYIWRVSQSLPNIAWFYFIYASVALVFEFPGAKVIKKIGVDWGMLVGTFFRFLYIICLILAQDNISFFWVSAFFLGICQPFDWLPYYYVIIKISTGKKKFGKAAGLASVYSQIGLAMGPLLGGMIIKLWGFNYLYVIGACLLILVATLPFLDKFDKKGMHVSFEDVKKAFRDSGISKHIFTQGIRSFDTLSDTMLWPLFLAITLGSVESFGFLQTISLIMAMIVTYMVGKFVDNRKFFMMYFGCLLNSGAWGLRYLLRTGLGLGIANSSYSLGTTMLWTPHTALLFARSSQKYTMEFWLVKEMINYFTLSLVALFYLGLFSLNNNLEILRGMFPILAIVSLLGLSIPTLYKKYIKLMNSWQNKKELS